MKNIIILILCGIMAYTGYEFNKVVNENIRLEKQAKAFKKQNLKIILEAEKIYNNLVLCVNTIEEIYNKLGISEKKKKQKKRED